jgi:serine/threonine-protein phosphatase 2A catalytic subunit
MSESTRKSLKTLLKSIQNSKTPSKSEVTLLCQKVSKLLTQEPNVLQIESPVTICGNIQGSLEDLQEIFKLSGPPPASNYLFLGNYINKGKFSVEVLCILFIYKILFPSKLTLLRGCHECAGAGQTYGFFQEILKKFGDFLVFEGFLKVFNCFPFAAVVGGQVFCVHSGISFSVETIEELMAVERFSDVKTDGPLMHLLWNFPFSGLGWSVSPKSYDFGFGTDVTSKFLEKNDLKMIVRSHQLVMEGFSQEQGGNIVTIFSASNFQLHKNLAAVLRFDENMKMEFLVYDWKFKEVWSFEDRLPDYFSCFERFTDFRVLSASKSLNS